ncbi:hypothetical protein DFH09DRAFT_907103 [Mycena vulgaris]|nr:hypothetical protein DFH09DRAFT_907103 [Mycena vulgaris]
MSDEDLDTIYSVIIVSGIINWNPDVLGSPDSMYNIAHEHIAIRTFQVVCAAHRYSRLGPNLKSLMDRVLLTGFYRNFVFSYILKLVKAEMKEPGRLDLIIANKKTYSRRTRVRNIYLLINSEERARTADPNDVTGSEISQRLPGPGVPLDWFDPEYFNAMPAAMRHTYENKGAIALPLEQHLTKNDWKNMDEATFMKKYGNDVLALYELPIAEEMAQMKENLQSDDENDEDEDTFDDEDPADDEMEQDG